VIRRLAAALALVALGIAVPIPTTPLHATGNTPCADNVGVTVVVDFHELGGGVNIACAPGPVSSGLDALDKAGIVWESVRRFPGFVCRIAGLPGPGTEACINTPPANAYWSYWVAARGGSWCYSSRGPGSRVPPPGSVEGWSFTLGKTGADTPPPGIPPPAPIDGQPPSPIGGADCGAPAGSPAPTTVAPVVPPPTTAAPQPPAPLTPPATTAAVASQAPTPTAPTTRTTAATVPPPVAVAAQSPTSSSPGSLVPTSISTSTSVVDATVVTSSTIESSTTPEVTADSGTVASNAVLGTVDLSDDGRGSGGFGAATAAGIAAAAGLIGAGVWAARRRRAVA